MKSRQLLPYLWTALDSKEPKRLFSSRSCPFWHSHISIFYKYVYQLRIHKAVNQLTFDMLTWWLCGVLILLRSIGSLPSVGAHDQKISTVLVARWSPTSILSEAAEFVSDVDGHLFWSYVDNLFDKVQHLPSPTSDEGETDLATVAAFELLSASKMRLMEWALRTRAYSPKVVMFQQLAPAIANDGRCESFVHLGGDNIYCSVDDLRNALNQPPQLSDEDEIVTVAVDHKYPSNVWNLLSLPDKNDSQPLVAVLYGSLSSKSTIQLHQYLKDQVNRVGYVYRPWEKPEENAEKLRLSGYGVELQFKSQEYKAQDDSNVNKPESGQEVAGFLFDTLQKNHPDDVENLEKLQNHLASTKGRKSEFEALKAWQVQELGLQACYFSTLQENVLDGLADVSGNFPSRAASLSSIKVPNDFKKAVSYNQRLLASQFNLDEGEGAFFLQGSFTDPDSVDLFSFMDSIRSEMDFMELLRAVYSDSVVTRDKINTILGLGAKASSEPDFALDMRDSSIFWINDLENDEEYEDWPDDLTQLFFRMGGVMLRPVRRNVFSLLITVNPDDIPTTSALLKMAQSFMAHKSPVRIGVVFCSPKSSNSNELVDELSTSVLIRRIMNYALSEGRTRRAFNDIVEALSTGEINLLKKRYSLVGEEFDFGAELACDFVKKSGRSTPGAFLNGVPLKWDSVDDFEEVVLNQLLREAQTVQIDAYNGRVRDDTDIFEYLMNKPNVLTRLNDKILDISNANYISFGTEAWEPGKALKNQYANLASSLTYLTPSDKRRTPVTVTIWVYADIGTEEGHKFLKTAIEFLSDSSTHSRVAFIPTDAGTSAFKDMVLAALAANDIDKLKKLLEEYSDDRTNTDGEIDPISANFMRLAGVPVGGKGLVVNGRIIGPLDEEDTFEVGDWALVEKFSYDSCAKYFDGDDRDADAVMRMCSALGNPNTKTKNSKRFTMPEFQKPHVVDTKRDLEDVFYVDLVAVVDPASRSGHKMAAFMAALKQAVGQWMKIQIVFNTPPKNSELPLKSYFRFLAGQRGQEEIVFENIPREPLFTQNMIAPDNWMVEIKRGMSDLDNIRLNDLGHSVESEYELEYILVEGHCLELKSGTPPRGLQFTLKPENNAQRPSETIVMANLGYFQLKAAPGVWTLALRDGPSRDIFSLETHNDKPVVVHSFQSVVIKVKVKRNPGKESVSLLETEEENAGSWFGFGSKKPEVEEQVINVFSVASGHLYERLLRIMMLSVLKNTQSKVKFWFLKNYLSPNVKDLLPELAKEYGFEYELVHYHWPRWLNPQREKQRIIWGYKILFLDVLFPLSLKKIVFVDADQIVRTDMKELFELDLEGNPYGYTPFCDSRTEMEGFRFWKHGYWKSHLGKRKYHISALYVVDLVRFRRVAAGDRLRGQYQALSQDPNSLSNLDQDLPNNMIYQVGIKSLPQEWLWCETWCSEESKKNAKTIDLCNNPQTKEPKLEAAQRIVPEWKDYDRELREFIVKVQTKTAGQTSDSEDRSVPDSSHDEHTEL